MVMLNSVEERIRRSDQKIADYNDTVDLLKGFDGDDTLKRVTKKQLKLMKKAGFTDLTEDTLVDDVKPDIDQNGKTIKISDLINDNFYPLFSVSNPIAAPTRIFSGGRSSFKSSAISIKLVKDFIEDDLANVMVFRKVGNTLSTSVYEQIKWAIHMLGLEGEFTFLKSPLKIIHKRTKSAFFFNGVDEPQKIKSNKVAIGYFLRLWFEEATEFDGIEEIDTVTDTFIRNDLPDNKQVEIYFSYNPPRNPYVWINEWLETVKTDDDYYVHYSTYLDDKKGFLSQQFIKKVKKTEQVDKDYHDWMYLGKVIGLGDTVYNYTLINVIPTLPTDDRILFADIALDTGYSVSATTFLFLGYTAKRRIILLDTFYYSPENVVQKKAPSEFSEELWEFYQRNTKKYNTNVDTWTIDSADGALRNQFFKDYSIPLTPARKKKKVNMTENVQDLFVENRFYVLDTENNAIFLDEHKKYQWDAKTKNTDDPKVIKVDDHSCDAMQYYVMNNLSKLGLRI